MTNYEKMTKAMPAELSRLLNNFVHKDFDEILTWYCKCVCQERDKCESMEECTVSDEKMILRWLGEVAK